MICWLIALVCYRLIPSTIAAPVQNITALQGQFAPAWVADPSGRGTWSLLYSCIFTLVLCVYTAIHLNVPGYGEGAWARWLRKVKWMLIALFTPEIAVYCAIQQWMKARVFLKKLAEIRKSKPQKLGQRNETPETSTFGMVYAFYALMGGFAVEVGHLHNALKRVVITPNGLLFLAEQGHFFEMGENSIKDKSKADKLAKGLVCVQVLWIVGQTIERKIAGYPIALLEVHTIVHVTCALIMYAFWFQKPFNIQDPTIVSTDAIQDLVAAMLEFRLPVEGGPNYVTLNAETGTRSTARDTSFAWYGHISSAPLPGCAKDMAESEVLDIDNHEEPLWLTYFATKAPDKCGHYRLHALNQTSSISIPSSGEGVICTVRSGQALMSGFGPSLSHHPDEKDEAQDHIDRVSLSQKDFLRLDLAAQYVSKQSTVGGSTNKPTAMEELDLPIAFYSHKRAGHSREAWPLLSYRISNFSGINDSSARAIPTAISGTPTAMSNTLVSSAYGGAHLAAMSIGFPTMIERDLWHISCIVIMTTFSIFWTILFIFFGCLMLCEILLEDPQSTRGNDPERRKPQPIANNPIKQGGWKVGNSLTNFIFWGMVLVMGLVYVSARAFIVVESFTALRHVPAMVYETPELNIMNHLPHL